jgi:AraC-like DNA-binding protein
MATNAGATTVDPHIRLFWEGWWPSGHIELRRQIYDCELVYVSRGKVELDLAGQRHLLLPGSLAIIPPAMLHQSFVPHDADVIRHCVHFDWTPEHSDSQAPMWTWHGEPFAAHLVHRPPPAIAAKLPLVLDIKAQRSLVEALEFALGLFRKRDVLAPWQLGVVLRWLLEPAKQPHAGANRQARSRDRVLALAHHIDQHFMTPLGHDDFLAISQLSSSQLCKLFNRLIGLRPIAYLHQVRIRNAQRLLLETNLPINQVAEMVGCPDANYFSRLFRQQVGASPAEFRTEHQAAAWTRRSRGDQ